ncbi:MAG: hypothetical protein LBT83_04930, partial [Tannerella sp.]|nr:hypothetical protein [Tannerella sp.]
VHENIKQIKVKKHGNRAKSLFKYGLQTIAAALLNPFAKFDFNVFEFLSCTYLSFINPPPTMQVVISIRDNLKCTP